MKRAVLALAGVCRAGRCSGGPADAQNTIKVGVPMPLSGPAALYGEPAVKGARMFVEEINAAGGVLGKKIELVVRDSKASADEAVRVSREMILKEEVQFLVGTLTSAEGPAVSTIAKENKIILIAPIPKTDQLTAEKNLHPYVFRTAANTTMEGRSAAEIIATWKDVKKVATIAHDYAYGQDVAKSFVDHIKKLRPDIEVVDQQWPKLGEADYTPFINAQMAKKPEAVFSAMWGGHFVTWAKQAKPLGFFDLVKNHVVNGGEAGSVEATRALGPDYPFGIYGNSYDLAAYAGQPEFAQEVHRPHQGLHEGRSSLDLADHRVRRHAVPGRRHQEGQLARQRQGREGVARPDDRCAVRQADPARVGPSGRSRSVLRQDDQGPGRQRHHDRSEVRRSQAVHVICTQCRKNAPLAGRAAHFCVSPSQGDKQLDASYCSPRAGTRVACLSCLIPSFCWASCARA